MTFEGFEARFNKGGLYDAMQMSTWFDTNSSGYPDEFDWWKKAVQYDA